MAEDITVELVEKEDFGKDCCTITLGEKQFRLRGLLFTCGRDGRASTCVVKTREAEKALIVGANCSTFPAEGGQQCLLWSDKTPNCRTGAMVAIKPRNSMDAKIFERIEDLIEILKTANKNKFVRWKKEFLGSADHERPACTKPANKPLRSPDLIKGVMDKGKSAKRQTTLDEGFGPASRFVDKACERKYGKRFGLASRTQGRSKPIADRSKPTLIPDTTTSFSKKKNYLQPTRVIGSGLKNLGNTCYMNAVMQSLFALFPLAKDVLWVGWGIIVKAMPALEEDTAENRDFFQTVVDTVRAATDPKSPLGDLKKLKSAIGGISAVFAGAGQEDAHEFFSDILNRIHEQILSRRYRVAITDVIQIAAGIGSFVVQQQDVPDGPQAAPQLVPIEEESHDILKVLAQKLSSCGSDADEGSAFDRFSLFSMMSPVTRSFHCETLSKSICLKCRHTRQHVESFLDWSVVIPEGKAWPLETLISKFCEPEKLAYKCEEPGCGGTHISLEHRLCSLPRVLAVHLKRFTWAEEAVADEDDDMLLAQRLAKTWAAEDAPLSAVSSDKKEEDSDDDILFGTDKVIKKSPGLEESLVELQETEGSPTESSEGKKKKPKRVVMKCQKRKVAVDIPLWLTLANLVSTDIDGAILPVAKPLGEDVLAGSPDMVSVEPEPGKVTIVPVPKAAVQSGLGRAVAPEPAVKPVGEKKNVVIEISSGSDDDDATDVEDGPTQVMQKPMAEEEEMDYDDDTEIEDAGERPEKRRRLNDDRQEFVPPISIVEQQSIYGTMFQNGAPVAGGVPGLCGAVSSGREGEMRYRIRCVCHHQGATPYSGHYYTDVHQRLQDGTERWVRFNDTDVRAVPEEAVLGPSGKKTAYIVLYEYSPPGMEFRADTDHVHVRAPAEPRPKPRSTPQSSRQPTLEFTRSTPAVSEGDFYRGASTPVGILFESLHQRGSPESVESVPTPTVPVDPPVRSGGYLASGRPSAPGNCSFSTSMASQRKFKKGKPGLFGQCVGVGGRRGAVLGKKVTRKPNPSPKGSSLDKVLELKRSSP